MSRLYEALTRRGREADQNTGVEWAALKVTETAAPLESPLESPPEPPVAPLAADVPVENDEGATVEEAPLPSQEAVSLTIGANVSPRLPLLPFAVGPVPVEEYRRLRTKILHHCTTEGLRRILIASGSPQEGKTVTVLNLALSFGMLPSFRVLVVDGDLRKGSIADWLGLDGSLPGLSNLIDGSASVRDVVLQSNDLPMSVVLRGSSPVPPAELLNSPDLRAHFDALTADFDLVLVDSPPVHLVTDAHLLVASCDAVIMVARAFSTSRKTLESAIQELAPVRVIGTILNGAPVARSRRYGYYRRESK